MHEATANSLTGKVSERCAASYYPATTPPVKSNLLQDPKIET